MPHPAIRVTNAFAFIALGVVLAITKDSWFPMALCSVLAIRS